VAEQEGLRHNDRKVVGSAPNQVAVKWLLRSLSLSSLQGRLSSNEARFALFFL